MVHARSGCEKDEPLPRRPVILAAVDLPQSERPFGLAPFHGRRDPREGIGGGRHGFGIHIDERLGQDPAARLADPSQPLPDGSTGRSSAS